jgi:beta-glucanase (GH16 family)
MKTNITRIIFFLLFSLISRIYAQNVDPYKPDNSKPLAKNGWNLVWNDEFTKDGKPDSVNWKYEKGFVRNKELQWYQSDNARCKDGLLIIEGRREKLKNPNYNPSGRDWKTSREYAEYTSASVITRGLHQWLYGRYEIRARIDTSLGMWPAIWTLGIEKPWPENGEIDLMEFYRVKHVPNILANVAWGTDKKWTAKWNSQKYPLSTIAKEDRSWAEKFHIWRMDWDKDAIKLYLDNVLLNTTLLKETLNPDGSNPFMQPHYLLLNLAIGENGGDPSHTKFPVKYEIDYVRVYQRN